MESEVPKAIWPTTLPTSRLPLPRGTHRFSKICQHRFEEVPSPISYGISAYFRNSKEFQATPSFYANLWKQIQINWGSIDQWFGQFSSKNCPIIWGSQGSFVSLYKTRSFMLLGLRAINMTHMKKPMYTNKGWNWDQDINWILSTA